jgi:hypothetical protein
VIFTASTSRSSSVPALGRRGRLRVWFGVGLALAAVSACSSDTPSITGAETGRTVDATMAIDSTSPPSTLPATTLATTTMPAGRLVSCGHEPPFPPDAVNGPLVELDDPDPLMAALREAGPRVGWATGPLRILARTDRYALIAEAYPPDAQLPSGVAPFNAWRLEYRDGAWHHAGNGSCRWFAWVDGMMASPWELDPALPPPGSDDAEVEVLVHEIACASGRSAAGRVRPPHIVYGASTIEIAITVTPAEGGQTCPGNPPTPFLITLSERLGNRQLLDSGRQPIAPPGPPPS